ncbi:MULTISPECIES: hypothetical protein [Methylobacterium]|uniref:DUF7940 domain-containing protein n=1 Tax=Methylobacterium TaxID=407 RepID=UPI00272E546B|nr:hypothetical protein [Methylobacterium sp.]
MRRPRLVPNARRVARHSWSFWLSLFGVVCSAVEAGMGVLAGSPPVDPTTFAFALTGVTLAGAVARLVAQPAISGDA